MVGSCEMSLAQQSRRRRRASIGHYTGWNIFRHKRSCTDDDFIADHDAAEHQGLGADPDVIAHPYRRDRAGYSAHNRFPMREPGSLCVMNMHPGATAVWLPIFTRPVKSIIVPVPMTDSLPIVKFENPAKGFTIMTSYTRTCAPICAPSKAKQRARTRG